MIHHQGVQSCAWLKLLVVIHICFVVCLVGVWQRNSEPAVCVYGPAGWPAGPYHYKNFCLMAMCQLLAVYLNNTFGGKFLLIFDVRESLCMKWMNFVGLWLGTTGITAGSSRVNVLHKIEITSQQYQCIPHKMDNDNFSDILLSFPRWNKMWPHNKQASTALTNTSNTFYKGTYVSYARDEIFKISKTVFFHD